MNKWINSVLIVAAVVLVSCNSNLASEESQQQGRLLVWHPFEGRAADTLNEIFDQYTTLHPNVTIVREFIPELQIASRFQEQIESGLGPDMMISPYIRAVELIEDGFIQALDDRQMDRSIYLDTALSQVQHEGKFYGLPLSMYVRMLCYNQQLVGAAPETFDALIEEARAGRRVGVFSTFAATYWGIPALGGRLLDESGRVVLDEGGMAEWYNYLKQTKLALETESQIPANNAINIDRRLSPTVAALVTQSKTAKGIPLDHIRQALAAAVVQGDIYQNRILEGEISPQAAAEELTRKVNQEFGLNQGGD